MPYIIIILFFIVAILALLEDKIPHKQVVMVVFAFATIMILLSGFREVGIDYDSANYASAYRDYEIVEGVDVSFLIISSFNIILRTFPSFCKLYSEKNFKNLIIQAGDLMYGWYYSNRTMYCNNSLLRWILFRRRFDCI